MAIISIREMASKHPFLTENSIRWLLYSDPEGLEDAIIRMGRRIYIEEEKFIDFVKKFSEKTKEIRKQKRLLRKEKNEQKV